MKPKDLLADIRNKLGPLATFVSLVEIETDLQEDFDTRGKALQKIREQLPQAKKSLEYVRKLKL